MNYKSVLSYLLFFTIASSFLLSGCTEKQEKTVQLELCSVPWHFPEGNALSKLSSQKTKATFDVPNDSSSFTIKLQLNLQKTGTAKTLLKIPGVLEVKTFQYDVNAGKHQNYQAFPLADGSVPVLEASLWLHLPVQPEETRSMPVGIPLAILKNPEGKHEVILHFTGPRWTIYVDNELLDNDFPLGYPKWGKETTWEIDPLLVSKAEIFFPGIEPQEITLATPRISPEIQYWTPTGHNNWVGDVATFYYEGRYHLFYLYDRRGHASKFGRGGHYFEHLSTVDFKTWTEHEAATPIEKQWETFGTGTPFVYNGQLCLSYGLHTTRIYSREKTTLPMQQKYLDDHGYEMSINYDTLTAGLPAGSTYSISEDGISNFKKTHLLFHHCENPSIYTDPEGNLKMLANYGSKGTWGSDSLNGGWKCLNKDFPPGNDCTFFFRWGNYDYIIGGFSHLWYKQKEQPDTKYESMEAKGQDFYNGLSVPAITEIANNRFLMAGWIKMQNWGGALAIYELVQLSDGQLGSKWMKEIIPATQKDITLSKEITETASFSTPTQSFMLTFEVHPNQPQKGKCALIFLPKEGKENACEWQIEISKERAQYSNCSIHSERVFQEKTLKEGGDVSTAYNYAIQSGMNIDKPFSVRVIVKQSDKWLGSVVDIEINGRRNMVSYRPVLRIEKLQFDVKEVRIKNVRIASLRN
ncbi:glycoside hydrolase family protein [Parabacteroides pacaensis]|uniref:hypothetical protein n=1 Tax=Parabacteroides pacaensis TaxID=2086575 RepID=UPI000D0FC1C8|nr:hypothetical protein [Parabacteroides pacaensis]